MNASEAASLLEVAASNRAIDRRISNHRCGVAWVIEKDTWLTVRWCTVSIYSAGCIRFRNNHNIMIPKRVWPFRRPHYKNIGKFEITIHESELTTAFLRMLIKIAETPTDNYLSDLFESGLITPIYCQSIKAKQQHEESRKKAADKLCGHFPN